MVNVTDKETRENTLRLVKNERSKKFYEEKTKQNLMTCDICSCQVSKYYYSQHVQTKRHKKWEETRKKVIEQEKPKQKKTKIVKIKEQI